MSRRNDRAARAMAMVAAGPDLGADGPAALARRCVNLPTDTAGVMCRQVIEAGPLHGMRLQQRQLDAASQLVKIWRDALPGRVRAGGYGSGGHDSRALTAEEDALAGQAARDYQAALDAVQFAAGVRAVIAIETTVIHHEAAHHTAHLPMALTALADYFELG